MQSAACFLGCWCRDTPHVAMLCCSRHSQALAGCHVWHASLLNTEASSWQPVTLQVSMFVTKVSTHMKSSNHTLEGLRIDFMSFVVYGSCKYLLTSRGHLTPRPIAQACNLRRTAYRTEPNWFAQKQIIVLKAVRYMRHQNVPRPATTCAVKHAQCMLGHLQFCTICAENKPLIPT
jgi:hypothetical protein